MSRCAHVLFMHKVHIISLEERKSDRRPWFVSCSELWVALGSYCEHSVRFRERLRFG